MSPRKGYRHQINKRAVGSKGRGSGWVWNYGEPWTRTEIAAFRRFYPVMSMSRLKRRFGRTRYAIAKKASRMGLRKSRWYDPHRTRFV